MLATFPRIRRGGSDQRSDERSGWRKTVSDECSRFKKVGCYVLKLVLEERWKGDMWPTICK